MAAATFAKVGVVTVASTIVYQFHNFHAKISHLSYEVEQLSKTKEHLEHEFYGANKTIPEMEDDGEGPPTDDIAGVVMHTLIILSILYTLWSIYATLREIQHKTKNDPFTSVGDVISYRIDYWFSASPASKPIVLVAATLILVLVGGFLMWLVAGEESESFTLLGAFWMCWILIVDTAAHGDFSDMGERFVGFIMTIAGMIVFGFMIGIVTDVISEKVDSLKKGKSRVVEKHHTLILGWSDKILPIITELCNSMQSEGGGVIVILSERDKEEMESDIQDADLELNNSTIVCRSGVPSHAYDLKKVSASAAKAIIVLADPSVKSNEWDAMALRITLTLTGIANLQGHIVVELCDVDNREIVQMVGKDNVETMVAHDIIGRLMLQSARQPGLAIILESVLGFDGSEFYMSEWPDLVGRTFDEMVFIFPAAIPLGFKRHEYLLMNPSGDEVFREGDKLLVLAEDDDTYEPDMENFARLQNVIKTGEEKTPVLPPADPIPENILFVGWRRQIDDMIIELNENVNPGSRLCLFCDVPLQERLDNLKDGGLKVEDLKNLTLEHAFGSPLSRKHLERLKLEDFGATLIWADGNLDGDTSKMDAQSLTSLLLIRDIQTKRFVNMIKAQKNDPKIKSYVDGAHTFSATADPAAIARAKGVAFKNIPQPIIISEILDSHTKALICKDASDYVASNELVSKAIAMVAEDQDVSSILAELLSSDGNETYLREPDIYLNEIEEIDFWDLMARARPRGEVVFGYSDHSGGIYINPLDKKKRLRYQDIDRVFVLSA